LRKKFQIGIAYNAIGLLLCWHLKNVGPATEA
jgi:hypothetical protein